MWKPSLLVAAVLPALLGLSAPARAQSAPAGTAPPSASRPAGAPSRARVAVLEFQVEAEDKSPALALQLQDGFVVGLSRTGIAVLDSVAVSKRMEATPELQQCDSAICLRQIGQALSVRHLVRVRVTVEGNSYKMTARLFGTEDAAAAVVVPRDNQSRFCDVCTVAEAREMMIRLGEAMRRPVEDAPTVVEAPLPAPAPPKSRAGAAVSLIAGLAAVAGGAVLLAGARDDEKRTAALAGALMGAGASLATVGLYLAFDGRGDRRREVNAGLTVAVRF